MKVTVLGCGPSLGVPVVGCKCDTCSSKLKFNQRTNSAIHLNENETSILIDFGLDIRHQLLRENITMLDAAILTHDHADHSGGIDMLRVFHLESKRPLPIYAESEVAKAVIQKHKYLFDKGFLEMRPINFGDVIKINNVEIQYFRQFHGKIDSLGIRIGNFVYSCDVSDFPENSWKFLRNIDTWILDCIAPTSTRGHGGIDKMLRWREEFKPRLIYLTSMSHLIDYEEIKKSLPASICPAYDGLRLNI